MESVNSNMGKWSGWATSDPIRLGSEETYRKAVGWLDGHGDIADLGGGTGYAGRFVKESDYSVVDGSQSKAVGTICDLAEYEGESDCVLLRHLLEHNENWQEILTNAVRSFRKRAAIVTFMPFEKEGPTRQVGEESAYFGSIGQSVPVLRLSEPEFLAIVEPYLVQCEVLGNEQLFLLEKPCF